ncbi:MAG: hypothetical protein PUF00_04325 [Paraprevotella sp.]|nr:hypothetical protein [Paraprevotella sp.]
MKIDITSMFFNSRIEGQTATPAWGTSIGQNKSRACRIDDFKSEVVDMVIGMTYKSVADINKLDVSKGSGNRDIITCSVFEDVYINNKKIDNSQYVLLLVREHSKNHDGRLLISYAPYIKYNGIENQSCINLMQQLLGCSAEGCWFVYDISIKNQSELYFSAVVVNPSSPVVYSNSIKSKNRSEEWKALIPLEGETESSTTNSISDSLQQIFYGAPGTGKSNKIKEEVDNLGKIHFRTTFHPDSDYSTFVGCYKPKSHKKNMLNGNGINETQLLSSFFDSNSPKYNRMNKARYLYEALVHTKDIRDLGLDAQMVADKLIAKGFTGCAYTTEATCMYNIFDWLKADGYIVENKITYEFTPQAFLKAYTEAWKHQATGDPVYLIIEEINRGNCAQIFGDIFQLLDRDPQGFSRYEISPDSDIQDYIGSLGLSISRIVNSEGKDVSAEIASGEILKLPDNLYIWATMNTSDQSLFPIDSAFKRRWEWKYIKIKEGKDENGNKLDWKVDVKMDEEGTLLPWWDFIKKINEIIASMTSSADKQLGYFFCYAKDDVIDEETFVSKVIFYLWNDVFKDYGFEDASLFRYTTKDEEGKDLDKDLTFPDFYDEEGEKVNTERLTDFVKKVMNWKKTNAEQD